MRPRLAVTVAVFASLTLLASACTTAPGSTTTPTTTAASAIQTLHDAVRAPALELVERAAGVLEDLAVD